MFQLSKIKKRFIFSKYHDIGQIQTIETVLNRNGYSLTDFESILDFGCGFGRLTKLLIEYAPNAKISGCEVNPDLVRRCIKSFPDAHFINNEVQPPLLSKDEEFDFIMSYSVFTHLDEETHIKWLRELSKKLKPGGVMIHSVHSRQAMRTMNLFSSEGLDKYNFEEGFDFIKSDGEKYHYNMYDNKLPDYGSTMIDKKYIINNWEDYSDMKILEFADAAMQTFPEGFHDLVLLKK